MPRNSWVQLPVHEVTVGRAALFASRVCCGVAPITGHYMYAHMRERRYVEGNWRGGKKRRKLEPRGPRLTRGGGALRRRFLLAINAAARFKPRMLPLRTTLVKRGRKLARSTGSRYCVKRVISGSSRACFMRCCERHAARRYERARKGPDVRGQSDVAR